ncbi:hypothetical protein, conserved [Eimeria acervulina]|uniref:Uncharacterized protein n=1 Tax=Eimeria acervulina TaxID=5801 RepID=U6GLJ6_EIMAC|nr:hypothetical protein, conserved [Eimeria acervulina]CDI81081.1 hypothetical protein, conserved [Eimeria acervulina]
MSIFTGRSGARGTGSRIPTGPPSMNNTTTANSSSNNNISSSSSSSSSSTFEASTRASGMQTGQQLVERLSDVSADALEKARQIVASMRGGSAQGEAADANSSYLLCFQLLKLAGLEAEIPRLVVFGQQSMGKTTLLDGRAAVGRVAAAVAAAVAADAAAILASAAAASAD